jgi:hypothetical protein
MNIAHLKLISFVPSKSGFDKRVGYITLGCVGPDRSSSVWDEEFTCPVTISCCRPGETFKKKQGVDTVKARLNRGNSFTIMASKYNWVQRTIDHLYPSTNWIDDAVESWQNNLCWAFKTHQPSDNKINIYPITFLNGLPLRK